MCGVLALVFIATTAAEVVLLVKIGSLIGALATFGIIITTGVLGAFLAKRAGARALVRLRESVQTGGTSLALVDGALVLAAGVTLLSPGFITDAVGIALLIAPIRAICARAILARLKGRIGDVMPFGGMPFGGASGGASSPFGPGSPFVGPADPAGAPGRESPADEDPPPPGVIDV